MTTPQQLLRRLDDIARSLAPTGRALALLGLGSVGAERARLDEYSDLDFFVIARDGQKEALLGDLGWLKAAHPVAYAFRNTPDGYKALFADEIYCEFAVLEVRELATIPFAAGRLVWQAPDFDATLAVPRRAPPPPEPRTVDWLVGEAATCLYVGLLRYLRGEKLSAMRFVQVFAVDRLVELAPLLEPETPAFRDTFAPERRFEQRFPLTARALADLAPGYDGTPRAAMAMLALLERHFEVNAAIKAAIVRAYERIERSG